MTSPPDHDVLSLLAEKQQHRYTQQGNILSFSDYLHLVQKKPEHYLRNSPRYLLDMLNHFGTRPADNPHLAETRYKLFDHATTDHPAVIGGEHAQKAIATTLRSFHNRGSAYKLMVLHGPNGSSKSSTVEAFASGMHHYSTLDEGAVYRFSWIFPKDKDLYSSITKDHGPIGFSSESLGAKHLSLSHLKEHKIASQIHSELKENPIYLLPMPFRKQFLLDIFSDTSDGPDENAIPHHLLREGLSKKNKEIFENLLSAYQGDVRAVYRHIKVERFYFSRHYRVGIATVEPQMSLDARERQLTMDRYIKDLPSALQTLSFFEYSGELVEGNRGIVEFSDFLKRPIESFKYLLATIEKNTIHLQSATALLDTVFIATTNDKHWDAFQEIPDFSSFFGRMHLITVPYLVIVKDEMKIYHHDISLLSSNVAIAPHTLYFLCLWAVMTRIKPPTTDDFPHEKHQALKSLNALTKALLYNHNDFRSSLSKTEKEFLRQNRDILLQQHLSTSHYEGKIGISPRHIRDILHRASEACNDGQLTTLDIFAQLETVIKMKKLYEFLRVLPRNEFFSPENSITLLKEEYAYTFEQELLESMAMVDAQEYDKLLSRYIDHVVANVRQEKVYDAASNTYLEPHLSWMKEMEEILNIQTEPKEFRRSLLSRIAAWKIDNPEKTYATDVVFEDLLKKIKQHFYSYRRKLIYSMCMNMIHLHHQELDGLSTTMQQSAQHTFDNLQQNYGYTNAATVQSLHFLLSMRSYDDQKSS